MSRATRLNTGVRQADVTATFAGLLGNANGTDDTAWLNAALAAGAGKVLRGTPGQTYKISAPLVIASGTTLDMTSCTVTLLPSSNCNMLRNANYASATTRDKNIAVVGGTWDRGANNGTNNDNHSLFLRKIDGLRIDGVTVLSTGGKYGIALGDTTNVTVRNIIGLCNSDTIHLTGPATDVLIEKVQTTGGDDAVGMTTTDYTSYDDVHGSFNRVTIRDITANTPTRAVLIATSASGTADNFLVENVTVERVLQTGTGHAIYVSGATPGTGWHDRISLSKIRGNIRLMAGYMKRVTVNECQNNGDAPLINVLPESGNVALDALTVRDCAHTATTTDSPLVMAQGAVNIKRLVMSGANAYLATGSRVLDVRGTSNVDTAAFDSCRIEAANTSTGDLVYKMDSTTIGVVSVANCTFVGTRGLLQNDGATAKTILNVANIYLTGCNRIAQGKNALDFNYANVNLVSQVNNPIYMNNGGALVVRGAGWSGYTSSAVVRQSTESLRVVARDFPVDLSLLAKSNGDQAFNTNASLACGAGPATTDGTSWKNQFSGATY